MDLDDIYGLCNYISNKEKSGNAFTPNQFNSIIGILNRDFFKKKVEESGYFDNRKNMSYNDHLKGSKNLHRFIHNETLAAAAATTYTYAYPLGVSDADTDTPIEVIYEEEYHDRLGDSNMVPSLTAPVALERGTNLIILPVTVANINLSYYFYPTNPFLDYYIDVNGIRQWLEEGDTHVWATGEIDSLGVTHTVGDPNWASLTVELEYNEDMHNDFLNEILSRVGVKLEKPEVTKMAEAWKQEQKQM